VAEPLSVVAPARAPTQPAFSADGAEIAFVLGGDIWTVASGGGRARLLVSHPAAESRPLFSPDGTRLAFLSDRGGDDDVYLLELASGRVERLTWRDGSEELGGWSADGAWLYFSSGADDVGGMHDVFRIRAAGGTPMPVSADAYAPEFHAAPAPPGVAGGTSADPVLAVAARGRMARGQWWRNGHSHIDEAEIWLVEPGGTPAYRPLSTGGKNLWPGWTVDGRVVFMSDRNGTENLWVVDPVADETARPLTTFTDGRLLWPRVSPDGRQVVFERDFGLWTLELPDGAPRRVEMTLQGAVQAPEVEHLSLTRGFRGLALSPDGEKVAFVVRGEVFAAAADSAGPAVRVTRTPDAESEPSWDAASRRLAFTSERDGVGSVFVHDFVTGEETRISDDAGWDVTPVFAPGGLRLAYVRDGEELRIHDLETGETRTVAAGQLWRAPFVSARPLAWSPDGRWLAYFATDARMFTHVHVVPADGSAPGRPVSRLANSFGGSLAWAPDGTALFFDTQHRTEDGRIARIDLVPRTPTFREDRFRELFRDEPGTPGDRIPDQDETEAGDRPAGAGQEAGGGAGDEPPATEIVFPGIFDRLTLLPTGVDAGTLALSPDGGTVVFEASAEGRENLYAFPLDPDADDPVARQLTSSSGGKGTPIFAPDGDEVYVLESGRIRRVPVDGGTPRGLDVVAELAVDGRATRLAAFHQGWRILRDHFYDPEMHGVDWEAVRERFEPRVEGAASQHDMTRLMNLMVGELDASHLGYRPPGGSDDPSTGRLGLRFDRGAYEADGALRVIGVVPLGPADVVEGIGPGDVLQAVDGAAVGPEVNLWSLLEGRVDERVVLTVADGVDGETREVAVRPASAGTERELVYRAWVAHRRAYVDSVSEGRLGYVHMPDMGWGSLQRLLVDLDAEAHGRDGVVVDLRNNNGGFVNAYALDVFAREGYLSMEIRGYPEVPARSMLGQRALEKPTALVVNQHTLSDGEDFTEGFRALGLGPVVGEPTAGWIIYTWGGSLVDGASFRVPRSRIRGAGGDVMERAPRPVDVEVERPLGESVTGGDRQLDAAVELLLERIGG
jgi:Tol biopolymer transport system component/C-terminal processing protease CtpA/Prc